MKNKEDVVVADETEGLGNLNKLQGDARDFLNAKKAGQLEDEAAKASLVEQKVSQIEGRKQIVNKNNEVVINRAAMDKRDITKDTHDVVVAGQSSSHPVSLEATADRPKKEKIAKAFGVTGLTFEMGATTASGVAALFHQGTVQVGDNSKIDKGPPRPTRDVPAKTALATILKAVNPVVQAYDKLHSSNDATVASTAANLMEAVTEGEVHMLGSKLPGQSPAPVITGVSTAAGLKVAIDRDYAPVKDTNAASDRRVSSGVKANNVEANLSNRLAESEQGTLVQQDAKDQTLGVKKTGQKGVDMEVNTTKSVSEGNGNNTNTKEGVWNVISARKSPTKQVVSHSQKSENVRPNASNFVTSQNSYEVLVDAGDFEVDATCLNDNVMSNN